jgi:hypothetical protein
LLVQLYAKTVTLGRTHWPETNRVMLRNRRIGCSMSGLAQFLARHGRSEHSTTGNSASLTSGTTNNTDSSTNTDTSSTALSANHQSSTSVTSAPSTEASETNSSTGLHELQRWSEAGYHAIQEYDKAYSEWFAIPRSIKTTSIKPSGTVSLLAGATPGLISRRFFSTAAIFLNVSSCSQFFYPES